MTQGNRAIVLLAAGHGHRFKGHEHKLMQPISDAGDTVLSRTLRHALESQLRVVVVASQLIEPVVQRWVARRDLVVLPATDARARRAARHGATPSRPAWRLRATPTGG